MSGSELQVLEGLTAPFQGLSDMRILEMPDCEPRAQAGALAHVEMHQLIRKPVVRQAVIDIEYLLSDFRGIQHLAFERQIGELVRGVDNSQRAAEFKTISEDRLGAQVNVLGSQIAVPLENASSRRTIVEELGIALDKTELKIGNLSNEMAGETPDRPQELIATGPNPGRDPKSISRPLDRDCGCRAVKKNERRDGGREICDAQAAAPDLLLQGVALSQPAHLHEPVDHSAHTTDRKRSIGSQNKRNDSEVDAGSKAAIETNFGLTVPVACDDRAEVEKRVPDRLLEFVCVPVRQKDPGHVGFDGPYSPWSLCIAGRAREKPNLLRERHTSSPRNVWGPRDAPAAGVCRTRSHLLGMLRKRPVAERLRSRRVQAGP